jgi:hypothetical protein
MCVYRRERRKGDENGIKRENEQGRRAEWFTVPVGGRGKKRQKIDLRRGKCTKES